MGLPKPPVTVNPREPVGVVPIDPAVPAPTELVGGSPMELMGVMPVPLMGAVTIAMGVGTMAPVPSWPMLVGVVPRLGGARLTGGGLRLAMLPTLPVLPGLAVTSNGEFTMTTLGRSTSLLFSLVSAKESVVSISAPRLTVPPGSDEGIWNGTLLVRDCPGASPDTLTLAMV